MFTGIVKALCKVSSLEKQPGLIRLSLDFSDYSTVGLEIGASVSVNGACLTVVSIEGPIVSFDIIQETLNRTNLAALQLGDLVNVERSAKFGDEIGGHILSGHVYGMATIAKVEAFQNNRVVTFKVPADWMKYLYPKGYIALDGASLTLVDVSPEGLFSVHLIPETLKKTTFGFKNEGSSVNVEIDSSTQVIVDTIERRLAAQNKL